MISIAEPSHVVFGSELATAEGSTAPQLVVFIHGIRSEPETFTILQEKLREKYKVPPSFRFVYFRYNYRESIAKSGEELARQLQRYGRYQI